MEAIKNAMQEELTLRGRAWLAAWIPRHHAAILLLPADQGNAVLRTPLQYDDDLALGPPLLAAALRVLEHGTSRLPATGVLTELDRHLATYLDASPF